METIDIWMMVSGIIYLFGSVLHYLHIVTIFHLLDRHEEMDHTKAAMLSAIWPVTVVQILLGYYDD
tara:strand:+ start:7819 stop:8016 length:198 start_codon:yes stop_codon:yes gene_type:complete